MSKEWKITIVALWIALVPFLGFPGAWKTFFIVVPALFIALVSFGDAVKKRLEQTGRGITHQEPVVASDQSLQEPQAIG